MKIEAYLLNIFLEVVKRFYQLRCGSKSCKNHILWDICYRNSIHFRKCPETIVKEYILFLPYKWTKVDKERKKRSTNRQWTFQLFEETIPKVWFIYWYRSCSCLSLVFPLIAGINQKIRPTDVRFRLISFVRIYSSYKNNVSFL